MADDKEKLTTDAEEDPTVGDAVKDSAVEWASSSGIHGVHHLVGNKGSLKKVIWLVLILISFAILIYQVVLMVQKFREYPTKTVTDRFPLEKINFPSVTFCDMNIVSRMALMKSDVKGVRDKFAKVLANDLAPKGSPASSPTITDNEVDEDTTTASPSTTENEVDEDTTTASPSTPENNVDTTTAYPDYTTTESVDDTTTASPDTPTTKSNDSTIHITCFTNQGTKCVNINVNVDSPHSRFTISTFPSTVISRKKRFVSERRHANRDTPYDDSTIEIGKRDENYEVETPRAKLQEEFKLIYSDLTALERKQIGKQAQDFIYQVTFDGQSFRHDAFEEFGNPKYGNCFTFNSGKFNIFNVEGTGPGVGLDVILAINQTDYLPSLTETSGVRLVIHDQKKMPFPDGEGYSLSPGFDTQIGLNLAIREHISPPHGRCKNFSDVEHKKMDGYTDHLSHVKYSFKACFATCMQQQIISHCQCIHPLFVSNSPLIQNMMRNVTKLPVCDIGKNASHGIKYGCVHNIRRYSGLSKCKAVCTPDCIEYLYNPTFSFSTWPAEPYYESMLLPDLKQKLKKKEPQLNITQKWVRSNLLRVSIYFEQLEIKYIRTVPAYDFNDFLSDLGGQMGLWLGISILTLFELIDLVYNVIWKSSAKEIK